MTKLRSAGLVISLAAATALLSAPVAFADGGHGDGHRGRDGGEHAVVATQNPANDDDVRDALERAQPQQVVEPELELNDVNDDND